MNTFEITIQRQPKDSDSYPVVVEHTRPDSYLPVRTEGGEFRFNDDVHMKLLRLSLDPKAYGLKLGELLFAGNVKEAFVEARGRSQVVDKPENALLHVYLSVEAPELKALRWERLCAPLDTEDWDHLARDMRFPFSIYLASATGRHFPPVGKHELQALILVANPQNLEEYSLKNFDAPTAVADIQAALAASHISYDTLGVDVPGVLGPPTLDQLRECLAKQNYHLLHIVAHGQFVRSGKDKGETRLYFANRHNQVEVVNATKLINALKGVSGRGGPPRFTFLVACESSDAEAEAEGGMGGLAQRLVRELGIHAVVAMTEKITISTALELAPKFYQQLHLHGEVDRALVEAGAGILRDDIIVPALYSRLGRRPLFSVDESSDPLDHQTIQSGLDRLVNVLADHPTIEPDQPVRFGRAPVLVDRVHELAVTLKANKNELREHEKEEWEKALKEVNSICEGAVDLDFRALALGQDPENYDGRCPSPGLLAFKAEDKDFFFGRKELIADLERRLEEHQILAVVGASGSGKSSLVLAGLIPKLESYMLYMTPGSMPLDSLDAVLQDIRHPKTKRENMILVVDQFEELFTLCEAEEQRRAFLDQLFKLVDSHTPQSPDFQSPPKIVITMRIDFLGDCAPYPQLRKIIQNNLALIPPMDSTELLSAIGYQISAVGLRFEADLEHTILDSVQGEPGAMSLLQHLLREMWKRRHGRWLLFSEYNRMGGVRRAITYTAEELYNKQTETGQDYLRTIFISLTHLGADGSHDTRHRMTLAALTSQGLDADWVKRLITQLADARLVVTSVEQLSEKSEIAGEHKIEVEVAHEALIRHWKRLREWLESDRAIYLLRQSVIEEAEDWDKHDRRESYLLRTGERAIEAESLLEHPRVELNETTSAYLERCIAPVWQRRRAEKYQRFINMFLEVEIHILGRQDQIYPIELNIKDSGGTVTFDGFIYADIMKRVASASVANAGKVLAENLFVNERLKIVWARVRKGWPHCRIGVRIAASATELNALPWEALCDISSPNGENQTLSSASDTPFFRAVTSKSLPSAPILERPLKVLIVIVNPTNLNYYDRAEIDVERARQTIQQAVVELNTESSTQLEFVILDARITLPTLEAALNKGYHILHLVIHCGYSDRAGTALFFADTMDGVQIIPIPQFADMISRLDQKPKLIFLNDDIITDANQRPAIAGLAIPLIDAGVSTLVFAERELPYESIRGFYQQLLIHGLVDIATNDIRSKLSKPGQSAQSIPILFSFVSKNQLFSFDEQKIDEWLNQRRVDENRPTLEVQNATVQSMAKEYIDVDICIHEERNSRYRDRYWVDIIVNKERVFASGYCDSDLSATISSPSPDEDGERLFKWLFADESLRIAWAILQWRYPKRRIQIQLAKTVPELSSIRWELLRQIENQIFPAQTIAASAATPFSRSLSGAQSFIEPIRERPVKILVVVSNPQNLFDYGLMSIDVDREKWIIHEAFSKVNADQFELEFITESVTLSAIKERLETGFHILHLIAHVKFDELMRDCRIFLADDNDEVALVKGGEFSDLFLHVSTKPHLVFFLNSGYSFRQDTSYDFSGLVQSLLKGGIPAVLGFNGNVPIETMRRFTPVFYQQLFEHGLVDLAVNKARSALLAHGLPYSLSPVLFSQLRDNELLRIGGLAVQSQNKLPVSTFESPQLESIGENLPPAGKLPQTASMSREPLSMSRESRLDDLLFFNGINGDTGSYDLDPMTSARLFDILSGGDEEKNIKDLQYRVQWENEKHL